MLFTLAATLILVKLGFWQIGRGIEKAELLNTIVQRQQHTVTSPLDVIGDVRGTMVALNGRIDSRNSLLLDNQTHNGQQGYRWFAPLFTGYGVVLLELGWVAAPYYRSELPALPSLAGDYLVSGVADMPSKRVTLAEAEQEATWPFRVQTVSVERFEKEIGESVLPWLVRWIRYLKQEIPTIFYPLLA
ncbi:SURF1 family protein [Veronia nyctiphanis]|uniref:SURF1 family protein n=1 Tax=Veronia nyctiphanis TaxID=1278244 RepID=UPI0022A87516|nr:SURF1 family protein [Veronia nyctiphanis]